MFKEQESSLAKKQQLVAKETTKEDQIRLKTELHETEILQNLRRARLEWSQKETTSRTSEDDCLTCKEERERERKREKEREKERERERKREKEREREKEGKAKIEKENKEPIDLSTEKEDFNINRTFNLA